MVDFPLLPTTRSECPLALQQRGALGRMNRSLDGRGLSGSRLFSQLVRSKPLLTPTNQGGNQLAGAAVCWDDDRPKASPDEQCGVPLVASPFRMKTARFF